MDFEKQVTRLSREYGCSLELFHERSRELAVSTQKWGLHANDASISEGFALRTLKGRRLGFYSFEREGELEKAVRKSLALGGKQEEGDYFFPSETGRSAKFFDRRADGSGEREAEAVERMLQVQEDAGVLAAQNIAGSYASEQALLNSEGGRISQKFSKFFAVSQCSFRESEGDDSFTSARADFSCEAVAEKASENAKATSGAERTSGGRVRAIFDVRALNQLLHLFLPFNFSGESLRKGLTKLKRGSQIGGGKISVYDDPFLAGGIGPAEYDGEGFAAGKLPLIRGGRVENFLFDMKTAAKMKGRKAGRGFREGYNSAPSPSFTNLSVLGGDSSDLVAECRRGIYVSCFLTSGANPVTGDFSFPLLVALKIERGELGKAVKGALLKGNFFSLLKTAEFERKAEMHNGLKSGRMACELQIIS